MAHLATTPTHSMAPLVKLDDRDLAALTLAAVAGLGVGLVTHELVDAALVASALWLFYRIGRANT